MPPKIEDMTPIESSMFSHSHYDGNSRVLTVRFKNGLTYEHHDVPAEKNEAFLGNPSKGSYYNKRIKPNHVGRKVEE
jgi:KTSC domain